jgi:hypothetical protein
MTTPPFSFKHFVDEVNLAPADLTQFFSAFVDNLVGQIITVGLYGISKYLIEIGPRESTSSIFEGKGSWYPQRFRTYRIEVVQEGGKVQLYFWSNQSITMARYSSTLMRKALHTTYSQFVSSTH